MLISKFNVGQQVATPGALEALRESGQGPEDFISRHVQCDWGDLSDEDKDLNDAAVINGDRILSSYLTADKARIWVITEAEDECGKRLATTILLPEEY
jgi:hypothetical protein